MGMAASQARYLALTARKTNTEYEGQQINQARTALANQSANLFNRLLDLEVPVAPKTTDYTELQYSFSDGDNESVIEEWTQLSSPNPDANYLVKHYYYTNKFTGSMKKLNDPQVQLNGGTVSTTNSGIAYALDEIDDAYVNIEKTSADLRAEAVEKEIVSAERVNDGYKVTFNDGTTEIFNIDTDNNDNDLFINTKGEVAFKNDLEALYGILPEGGKLVLPVIDGGNSEEQINAYNNALKTYDEKVAYYNDLKIPTHVGNCELIPFDQTDKDQMTQIKQIITDMKEQNINDGISKCFDENGNYTGGIFSFQMNGQQYFTTYEELLASYDSHTGPNDIDGQIKLPYYNTSYIKTRIEQTDKALLETDSNGRFTSVKFADNSLTYVLNTETVTDEAAYQDAMNEYNYKVQQYEKTIADINARTSIIQEEDRTLELRLKQLDTEQKALSTEMDAVKKVISDNIEKTFKTFSD